MNIVHITPESQELLSKYGKENKKLIVAVRFYGKNYFERVALEYDSLCIAYFTAKKDRVKFNIKSLGKDSKQYSKGYFAPSNNYIYDIHFEITQKFDGKEFEEYKILIETVISDYVNVNNLFIYGNIVNGKSTQIKSRTDENDKHYFIKEFENNLYAVSSHSHRSPKGVFGVRGHFRKYKSGKIIWIDEYLKGLNK